MKYNDEFKSYDCRNDLDFVVIQFGCFFLSAQAMNLRSELENYKSEYERLMVELQALDLVKDEHRRNVNT
jgi:hypothetical protein